MLVQTEGSKRQTETTSRPASIDYDTATGAYTFREVDGTSFTLTPDELIAAESSASYSIYLDAASGVNFKLLNPGAGNTLIALDHVRYAKWTRAVAPLTGFSTAQKSDWMLFGDRTAAAAIPRTGSATYSAIIDGDYHDSAGDYVLSGTAGLTADFASSSLSMFINPVATHTATGNVLTFGARYGSGAIDYTLGQFTGSDSAANYTFSYIGNFYGAGAEEVGGTFNLANNYYFGGIGTGQGVFVGKIGDLPVPAAEPPPPPVVPGLIGRQYERITQHRSFGDSSQTQLGGSSVKYDTVTQTYVLREFDGSTLDLSPGEVVAAESNDAFTVYKDAASGTKVRMLNQGPSNPQIALNYVSYAAWTRSIDPSIGYTSADKTVYTVFGNQTAPASMPRTGSATYNAMLDGNYVANRQTYAVSGTARFNADFATGTIGFALSPVGAAGVQTINFGTLSGTGTISGAGFGANNGYGKAYQTTVFGSFYGPAAEEVGGVFSLAGFAGYGGVSGSGGGIFVGKR